MYTADNFKKADEETFILKISPDRDFKILQLTDLHLGFGLFSKKRDQLALKAVSTIGAGDNFNAGVVYGLLKYRVRRADLAELTEADWDAIIRCGMDFSADVCKSVSNSVSKEFAESYR